MSFPPIRVFRDIPHVSFTGEPKEFDILKPYQCDSASLNVPWRGRHSLRPSWSRVQERAGSTSHAPVFDRRMVVPAKMLRVATQVTSASIVLFGLRLIDNLGWSEASVGRGF